MKLINNPIQTEFSLHPPEMICGGINQVLFKIKKARKHSVYGLLVEFGAFLAEKEELSYP